MDLAGDRRVYIGSWLAQPSLNRLTRGGETVRLHPKAMRVLMLLYEERGRLVSRQELLDRVWEGAFVGDDVITQAVSELRRALGDRAAAPRFIETIPKSGYRLIADSTPPRSSEAAPAVEVGQHARSRRSSTRWRMSSLAAASAIGAVALAGFLAWHWVERQPELSPGSPAAAMPITTFPGSETDPAISPDGARIAFVRDGDIYVQTLGSDRPGRITHSPARESALAWNPDGSRLAFVRDTDGVCALVIAATAGGVERELTACHAAHSTGLDWHPNGNWLAYADSPAGFASQRVRLLSLGNLETFALEGSKNGASTSSDSHPAFSPDGTMLAFARSELGGTAVYVRPLPEWVARSSGPAIPASAATRRTADSRRLTGYYSAVEGLDWTSDGLAVVFSAVEAGTAGIWRAPVGGGKPSWIGLQGGSLLSPSVALTGERLAVAQLTIEQNIWGVRIAEGNLEGAPRPVIQSTRIDLNPRLSPDGRRVAFSSTRSGAVELWTSAADGSQPRQLTRLERRFSVLPSWSPDGSRLAFSSTVGETFDVYTIPSDGGRPRRLTTHRANDGSATWSADGSWIYFSSDRTGRFEIWKMPAAGGEPARVTRSGGIAPLEEDGFLYFSKPFEPGVWRRSLETGAEQRILSFLEARDWNNWTVSGGGIYFARRGPDDRVTVAYYDLATRDITDLFEPPGDIVGDLAGLSVSSEPSHNLLLFTQVDRFESDVVLFESFLSR